MSDRMLHRCWGDPTPLTACRAPVADEFGALHATFCAALTAPHTTHSTHPTCSLCSRSPTGHRGRPAPPYPTSCSEPPLPMEQMPTEVEVSQSHAGPWAGQGAIPLAPNHSATHIKRACHCTAAMAARQCAVIGSRLCHPLLYHRDRMGLGILLGGHLCAVQLKGGPPLPAPAPLMTPLLRRHSPAVRSAYRSTLLQGLP